MSDQSQISATVSVATKEKLDRFSESHGLKKNFVVEQALLYFMEARRELPDEAFIPARLVLDDKVFDRVVDLLGHEQQHGGGAPVVFAIGGAGGHSDLVRDRARKLISFGRLTIAHRLVRVLVLEQIYRGFKILRGEPYHRD